MENIPSPRIVVGIDAVGVLTAVYADVPVHVVVRDWAYIRTSEDDPTDSDFYDDPLEGADLPNEQYPLTVLGGGK